MTIAITDRKNLSVAALLSKLTGKAIFPVLVEPSRVNLLINRLERYKRDEHNTLGYLYSLHRLQINSMVMTLIYKGIRKK
jgi:hypothetical protein